MDWGPAVSILEALWYTFVFLLTLSFNGCKKNGLRPQPHYHWELTRNVNSQTYWIKHYRDETQQSALTSLPGNSEACCCLKIRVLLRLCVSILSSTPNWNGMDGFHYFPSLWMCSKHLLHIGAKILIINPGIISVSEIRAWVLHFVL